MNRQQLEHIIRSASEITDEYEFIIIGSQSILGTYPAPLSFFCQSMEADIYPYRAHHKSDVIDGTIGEESHFHATFGYYAQGVSPNTAILPRDWENRLTAIRLDDSVGYCIDIHDLAVSKIVANRPKDIEFVMQLLNHKMIEKSRVLELIDMLPEHRLMPSVMLKAKTTFNIICSKLDNQEKYINNSTGLTI